MVGVMASGGGGGRGEPEVQPSSPRKTPCARVISHWGKAGASAVVGEEVPLRSGFPCVQRLAALVPWSPSGPSPLTQRS